MQFLNYRHLVLRIFTYFYWGKKIQMLIMKMIFVLSFFFSPPQHKHLLNVLFISSGVKFLFWGQNASSAPLGHYIMSLSTFTLHLFTKVSSSSFSMSVSLDRMLLASWASTHVIFSSSVRCDQVPSGNVNCLLKQIFNKGNINEFHPLKRIWSNPTSKKVLHLVFPRI